MSFSDYGDNDGDGDEADDVGTYTVAFTTRVCGIELVPLVASETLSAVVIKCHTQFAKEHVIRNSLLVGINAQLYVDCDSDDILSAISLSTRPLRLSFASFAYRDAANASHLHIA